ncbi:P-loop NTPase [Candidatus Haliotispira prima]|uniref:P-loop NTPase n=1 Tax=Candidatus Haliotispira prima TaxID=3034016 RepID=A0ABY8MEW5_9SPIO|nr:P-loop NTPase [Candidatus Haliotispira prima]
MQIIAIASGKGGVGKSMLSSNLAVALGQNGKRVIAVDMDLGGSNLHLTLGAMGLPKGVGTYFDNPLTRLEDIIYPTDYKNLSIIPGESELPGIANVPPAPKQRLLHDLRRLDCDYLLLDLGAGTHYNTMDFFLLSGNGILVTNPTLTATLNAYLFLKNSVFRIMGSKFRKDSMAYSYLKQLKKDGVSLQKIYLTKLLYQIKEIDPHSYEKVEQGMRLLRPKIVLNMVNDPKDMQRANKLRSSCCQYLSVDIEHLGVIYYDEVQSRALNARLPVVAYKPQAIISQAVYRIADRILEMDSRNVSPLSGEDAETEYGGLFNHSYEMAGKEADDDYQLRRSQLQESLHSGMLSEGDMIETIKSQQFDVQQLKLENQFLKKKILDMAKKEK